MTTKEQPPSEERSKTCHLLPAASLYLPPTAELTLPTTETEPSETPTTQEDYPKSLHLASLSGLWQLDTAAGFIGIPAKHPAIPSPLHPLRWDAPVP